MSTPILRSQLEGEPDAGALYLYEHSPVFVGENVSQALTTGATPIRTGQITGYAISGSLNEDHATLKSTAEFMNFRTKHQPLNAFGISAARDLIFFIDRPHSLAPLAVTRAMMEDIMREFQVFSNLKEFLAIFGPLKTDFQLPQCVFRIAKNRAQATAGYECAYAFGTVDVRAKSEEEDPETKKLMTVWPIRNTAVYHRVVNHDSQPQNLWILFAAPQLLKETLLACSRHMAQKTDQQACFRTHLLLQNCTVGNWKPYLRWLDREVDYHTNRARSAPTRELSLATNPIRPSPTAPTPQLVAEELKPIQLSQLLQETQEHMEHAALCLDALSETISSLRDVSIRDFKIDNTLIGPRSSCKELGERFGERLRGCASKVRQLVSIQQRAASTVNLYSRLSETNNETITNQMADLQWRTKKDQDVTLVLTLLTAAFLPTAVIGSYFTVYPPTDTKDARQDARGTGIYWGTILGAASGSFLFFWIFRRFKTYGWWSLNSLWPFIGKE